VIDTVVDGYAVRYFCAGDEMAAADTADLIGYAFRDDSVAFDHPRLRRAIVAFPWRDGPPRRIYGILHWSDGTDLEALDQRARASEDIAPAVDRALFCQVRGATCQRCGSNVRMAAVDGGIPVATLARRRDHGVRSSCPMCGDERFVPHTEVLTDA